MSVERAFQDLQVKMNEQREGIQRLNAGYQFDLNDGKVYQFSFKDGKVDANRRRDGV